ncbi:MAG: DNA starvation/stationary phase protection protein Dps [Trueperaceae bacterium]
MPATKSKLHATKIDIPEKTRVELVDLLNARLADTADLASQLKQAHWNVKGKDFQQLHELFDAVEAAVHPYVDMLAERATTLGATAMGTVRMAAKSSKLTEYPADITNGKDHLMAVRDRLAKYAGLVREAIGKASDLDEPTTEDLFTEISRTVDLQLYFVEAHLQD